MARRCLHAGGPLFALALFRVPEYHPNPARSAAADSRGLAGFCARARPLAPFTTSQQDPSTQVHNRAGACHPAPPRATRDYRFDYRATTVYYRMRSAYRVYLPKNAGI